MCDITNDFSFLEDGQPNHLLKPRAILQTEAELLAWRISDREALRTPPYTTARPNESPARRLPTIVAWCARPNL